MQGQVYTVVNTNVLYMGKYNVPTPNPDSAGLRAYTYHFMSSFLQLHREDAVMTCQFGDEYTQVHRPSFQPFAQGHSHAR